MSQTSRQENGGGCSGEEKEADVPKDVTESQSKQLMEHALGTAQGPEFLNLPCLHSVGLVCVVAIRPPNPRRQETFWKLLHSPG